MSTIEVIRKHFIGKTITSGVREGVGKKILDCQFHPYETILELTVTDGTTTENVDILMDWDIGLTG